MMASRCSPLRRMVPTYSARLAASWSLSPASRSAKPRMAVMGVRISWLMLARNSLLAALAASAAAWAAMSRASASFCLVMSNRIEMYRSTEPPAPTYGTIVLSTQ